MMGISVDPGWVALFRLPVSFSLPPQDEQKFPSALTLIAWTPNCPGGCDLG